MNEYEQHGALTDEKREDLSQLVSEFMAKGVVKGGRAGHEAIAEATLILFPGTFEDDPKTLAEALYNRLSRQTQQRYGTESPEDIHSLLTVKQEQIFSVEDIVSENDTFRIPAVCFKITTQRRRRAHTSAIWHAFDINEETNHARCRKCDTTVMHNKKATSNLLKHAKKDEEHLKWFTRLSRSLQNHIEFDETQSDSDY
ncbi:uncharacterized protein LOC134836170 isoform X6 [Culicoides brevitarsis]|uniref:uncharacterized protein LOC134836170 isoform X6 n=1 Tax=Culicoides brevitarsis TaxID=469753 RepID=UPI00307B2C9A